MESRDLPRKQQCVSDIQLREGVFEAPFYCLMVGENNSPYLVFLGFLCESAGKESACNAGNLGSFPGLGKSSGEGNDSSILAWRIPMDRGACWATVQGVAKSQTGLSD